MNMKKPETLIWTLRLMISAGMLLSMSAMLGFWFLLLGTQLFLIPYSYVGWVFFVAVGFAFFVKPQIAQVVISVHPFIKTSALLTLEPIIFFGN
jgi:hypothetical protein